VPTRALVVVDVQFDFADPQGSLYVAGGEHVASRIHDELLVDPFHDLVVATRDHHGDPGSHFSEKPDFKESWPPHCVAGTPGVELHGNLVQRDGPHFAATFDKGEHAAAYSGFEGRDAATGESLGEYLGARGVMSVDVVGLALDYCVLATALDSFAAGFETRVLLDYTASVTDASAASALAQLVEAGVDVVRGSIRPV
jgi:nicotinamidase/pyrazinamidase